MALPKSQSEVREFLERRNREGLQRAERVKKRGKGHFLFFTGIIRYSTLCAILLSFAIGIILPGWRPLGEALPAFVQRFLVLYPASCIIGFLVARRVWSSWEKHWFPLLIRSDEKA